MKISILGLGLIGGSLALCLKDHFYTIGYSLEKRNEYEFCVHEIANTFEEAVVKADIIFLCMPVDEIERSLIRLKKIPLKPHCLITDVGSTKRHIIETAGTLSFIGGHPMAGSEKTGMKAATTTLFENAYYVLVPNAHVLENQINTLKHILSFTKARTLVLTAEEHDQMVGAVSHLPHIIAVGLVNQIRKYSEGHEAYTLLAAGGFRDLTRIASSHPSLWRNILLKNRSVLFSLLEDWQMEMTTFKQWLEEEDGEKIQAAFETAKDYREKITNRVSGLIAPEFHLDIMVPDVPGVIGEVTVLFGKAQLNLVNIQIMHSRLDVPGILRCTFSNAHDQESAKELVKKAGYESGK